MLMQMMLLACAFLCFVLATFQVPTPRVNLVAGGLAFYVLSQLIGRL
jgi:hypothetical protein